MKFTITEMSVGEILERAFKLFFSRLPVFFAIQLITLSPTLIMQLVMPDVAISPFGNFLVVLPMIILGPIGSAAMLRVITQEYLGQPIGLVEAFQFALGRFLPLLGTSILMGLGIGLGVLLCCIPGIYLAIVWSFMSQVVVMENLAGMEALSRSKSLVEGYFWRVFGVLLLVGLLVGFLNGAINFGLTLGLPFMDVVPGANPAFPVMRLNNFLNFAIVQVTSTLVNSLGQTFVPICATLLYFDLRNRKEAFNMEQLVAWIDQYRTWRDEPDPSFPMSGNTGPSETGIKPADGSVPPPQTGIQDTGGPATTPESHIKNPGDEPPKPGN